MHPPFIEPLEEFGWINEDRNDQIHRSENPELSQLNERSLFDY
jgi:hypothetical protein